ncbi:MAG: phosphoribosyltransferase [Betaproteobacteria bacterium]|nr:phosphoribosyltransferase [Betaproteobacteria bacterium]
MEPLREIERAPRTPWGDFPDALIHQTSIPTVQRHPKYRAAKDGDIASAVQLVDDTLNPVLVDRIVAELRGRSAILVPVFAEEAYGVNRIPMVMAEALEAHLQGRASINVTADIVQANRAGHTGASGWTRIAHPTLFDGPIEKGSAYVIVDDFIGQGGTIANLKGYIESHGGEVILATTLTGQAYSAKLVSVETTLAALRAKHGKELEDWWRSTFGYGFERLTESEARYLTRAEDADIIRNRLAQARRQANP